MTTSVDPDQTAPILFAQDCLSENLGTLWYKKYMYFNWAGTLQNLENDCASSKDSDQPEHLYSLISFAICLTTTFVPGYPLNSQGRLWSDCKIGRLT